VIEDRVAYCFLPDPRSRVQKRLDLVLAREPLADFLQHNLDLIEAVSPDIVQVFGTEMDYGLISSKVKQPVIIHLQGFLHPCLHQLRNNLRRSWYEEFQAHSLWDYITGRTMSNARSVMSGRLRTERKILADAKFLMGRTSWDLSISKLFAPEAVYYHCEEALQEIYLTSEWSPELGGVPTIVSTLSNPAYKGHDLLVATAEVLHDLMGDFRWNVIGLEKGAPSYKLFYSKASRVVSGRIEACGRMSPHQVLELLSKASVYVHPSHVENSSNSLCEAMAMGMPVIALHVGGNPSIVQNGEDGILVSDNDPYALAYEIWRLVRDAAYARQLGGRAKHRALRRHEPRQVAADLLSIYEKVIDEAQSQPA
jgi:glycosyltransferase involved in cell wall biosynthesis